jgi:hypothetical protein
LSRAPDRLPPTSHSDRVLVCPIRVRLVVILGSATPVASRFGHWGGVINFVLVITLACAPAPHLLGRLVRRAAPLIAIFYLAAIIERALSYPPSRPISRRT